MIVLTRLNGKDQFGINPDLIERIHASPDTTLVLVCGTRHIVAETLDEVIETIIEFRARVLRTARDLPTAEVAAPLSHLSVVPPNDVVPADPGHRSRK